MCRDQKRKPTRRKPSRPHKQGHYSTVAEYKAPWYTYLYGVLVVFAMLGFVTLMAYGYQQGWWW